MKNVEKSEANISKLRLQLKNAGIDISIWGTGGYKTLEHLAKEIDCKEIVLTTDENGELIRISEVVAAKIFYNHDDGKTYRLKEEKQVL